MRAEDPVRTGQVVRDGVRTAYEVYGTEGPTLVLLPCWIIAHARSWKAQIADLAQDYRLIVVEGRGNGASDRPVEPAAYAATAYVEDALAVIDALEVGDCALLGFSMSAALAALVAQRRPGQVKAIVMIGPVAPRTAAERAALEAFFLAELPAYEGWAKYNAASFRDDYDGFARFFFERVFVEPHSTKQIEDGVGWAGETTAQVLTATVLGGLRDDTDLEAVYAAVT
ncbi:MAG TPA: alpha/beta hydrolase, partial [Caulobacteraceae bacterium]|nr:alpha/beta hydrolase [Caulobacteraceae bacterium]